MPNWTAQRLSFDIMTDEEWEAFKKKHFTKENELDFETIIPSPKTIGECEPQYLVDEKSHIEEKKERPWFDWYKWRCYNWGTKWNACDTSYDNSSRSIYFDTAWSPAEPIIHALAKLYPQFVIDYAYAEEQGAEYCGVGWKNAGEDEIFISEYDSDSKEAWETYFDLWGGEDEYYYDEEEETYVYDEDGRYEEIAELKKDVLKVLNT